MIKRYAGTKIDIDVSLLHKVYGWLDVTIKGNVYPGEPRTYHDPGNAGEVELLTAESADTGYPFKFEDFEAKSLEAAEDQAIEVAREIEISAFEDYKEDR